MLVKSGKLRIDAYEKINFVRYPTEGSTLFFTHRELHDPKLVPITKKIIGAEKLKTLRKNIKNNIPVPVALEEKIARILVQSTHPSVMLLALTEGVEIFVSFSHKIADLLDLQTYQYHGDNSGMQSLGYDESRVFVSTDGNPFATSGEDKEHAKYSLSRFQVIAAQELGHYADIKRNKSGATIGRHSASMMTMRPHAKVQRARLADIKRISKISRDLNKLGLKKIAKTEKSISFYKKHRPNSLKYYSTVIKSVLQNFFLKRAAIKSGLKIAKLHSPKNLVIMLADMKFNLEPKAPVYMRESKIQQDGIACVEALARVPQQVIKWGHETTKFLYPEMYKIYYGEVIPNVVQAYEAMTGRKFKP